MRVTPHSTLTISTCALALLSQISSVYTAGGDTFKEGRPTKSTISKIYVEKYQKELGLSNIRWGGGNDHDLSLARVTWNNQDAFMKCDTATNEVDAFRALKEAKRMSEARKLEIGKLTDDYATGRQNVMDPLHQFGFYDSNNKEYFCHLYSYINGGTLEDYFKKHTISQAFVLAFEILPKIIRGSIYLYNAGIIHDDLLPNNIMLQLDPADRIISAKIIDLDNTFLFKKQQDWTPIAPNNKEYSLRNLRQKYESCDELTHVIARFLKVFVSLKGGEKPFNRNYKLTEQAAQSYLERLKHTRRYTKSELGNAKVAIPAMLRLTQTLYIIQFDPFTCSSPILALEGLPPRIPSF